jgi:type IV pilus assembly protein PilO
MKHKLKIPMIPWRYMAALMLFMPAVIIVAAYFLLFDAQLREKKRLDAEVKGLRQELLKVTAMKNSMEKTRREYAALNAELHYRLRQMPEEKEVPNLLRQVSLVARETKTHMKYFAPKESGAREFYLELPFEMRYTGSYHSIGYFFDGIRKLERIIHITSFSLEAKEAGQKGALAGSCLAKTYVFMKEPLPPASGGVGSRTGAGRPGYPLAGATAGPQPAKTAGSGGKE